MQKSFVKCALAALPVLAGTLTLADAFSMATLCAIVFAALAIFYKNTWNLFPKNMLGFSVIFTLACLGSCAWYFLDITPVWVASVFVLGVFDFKIKSYKSGSREKGRAKRVISNSMMAILQRAVIYWLLITGFGAIHSAAGAAGPAVFRVPPGVDLLILGVVIFWTRLLPAAKANKGLEENG